MTPQKKVEEQIKDVLTDNHVKMIYKISFPIYRQLPDEVSLALLVLNRHGMTITVSYEPDSQQGLS